MTSSTTAPAPAATNDEPDVLGPTIANARAEGVREGTAAGRKAERARFAAILGDEKVKGREQTALDLAIKSPDMSAEDVVAFVAALPAPAAAADKPATPTIAERMAGQGTALALGVPIMTPASERKVAAPKASEVYATRRAAREKRAA